MSRAKPSALDVSADLSGTQLTAILALGKQLVSTRSGAAAPSAVIDTAIKACAAMDPLSERAWPAARLQFAVASRGQRLEAVQETFRRSMASWTASALNEFVQQHVAQTPVCLLARTSGGATSTLVGALAESMLPDVELLSPVAVGCLASALDEDLIHALSHSMEIAQAANSAVWTHHMALAAAAHGQRARGLSDMVLTRTARADCLGELVRIAARERGVLGPALTMLRRMESRLAGTGDEAARMGQLRSHLATYLNAVVKVLARGDHAPVDELPEVAVRLAAVWGLDPAAAARALAGACHDHLWEGRVGRPDLISVCLEFIAERRQLTPDLLDLARRALLQPGCGQRAQAVANHLVELAIQIQIEGRHGCAVTSAEAAVRRDGRACFDSTLQVPIVPLPGIRYTAAQLRF